MPTIQNYKCPCCDASLIFEAGSGTLHCEFCGSNFSPLNMEPVTGEEKVTVAESKYDWDSYSERCFDEVEAEMLATYVCPSCGAGVTGDTNLGSTLCPYCGNATIIRKTFEGALKPDYVIPFKVNKKDALELFEAACTKAPFLPETFKKERKLEKITGLYVPFWTFDGDCNAKISYRAQKESHWSDANYNYKKTEYYNVFRAGDMLFENIPADASKKISDTYTEALEPFDYSEAVNFNTSYLSGFIADKYDVNNDEVRPRITERVKKSAENELGATVAGYTSYNISNQNINYQNKKIRYCLLPLWMMNIKYKDIMYKYAINGQTGKVVGEYPVDKKKKWLYFLKVYLISLGIAVAGTLILRAFME